MQCAQPSQDVAHRKAPGDSFLHGRLGYIVVTSLIPSGKWGDLFIEIDAR